MPEVSRQLLEDAAGYVVYGYDGRRLGTVIELVTGGAGRGDSVAIRRDRIFLWRRRTLPVAAVASIDPQERTVTLSLDSTGIERAHDRHAEEIRQGSIADLIAPYADAPTPQTTAQTHDADGASCRQMPVSVPSGEDSTSASTEPVGEGEPVGEAAGEHWLFAPTTAGYLLIERAGSPPPLAGTLELSDPPGRFQVVKLAQSPLPGDRRLCAFLDRTA
jgi:hypothetical protein